MNGIDNQSTMSRVLYFDCFSGIAGDMVLGALLDAGLPFDDLKRALGSLAISGYEVTTERVLRAGVSATKFRVHEHSTGGANEHSTGEASSTLRCSSQHRGDAASSTTTMTVTPIAI